MKDTAKADEGVRNEVWASVGEGRCVGVEKGSKKDKVCKKNNLRFREV